VNKLFYRDNESVIITSDIHMHLDAYIHQPNNTYLKIYDLSHRSVVLMDIKTD